MTTPGERDIDLVLVTGAGASYDMGASGTQIAAMKEWSDRLTGALGNDPGSSLLVGLQLGLDGMEFERQLGKFLASARAYRDASDLILASANLTYSTDAVRFLATRDNISGWHAQVNLSIDQVFDVIHTTLYDLFGDPSFDLQKAHSAYQELLAQLDIASRATNWVYATTNYDKIAEEALQQAGFRVAWGEQQRARGGDRVIDPEGLLDGVKGTVPVLHLHGRIGWYRRRASEGGAAYAADMVTHQTGFGTPIAMLPAPTKVYDSDPVINSLWAQFNDALSRAKFVFVLGHSLNDAQLVAALRDNVPASRIAVGVLPQETKSAGPALAPLSLSTDPDDLTGVEPGSVEERARTQIGGNVAIIPLRFGEPLEKSRASIVDWLARERDKGHV